MSEYVFDAKQVTQDLIDWAKEWFKNKEGSKVIVGISGGKDSTVSAALLCEALGKDRVIGVSMPNGVQPDIDDANKVFEVLGIRRVDINIEKAYNSLITQLYDNEIVYTKQTQENLPARLRMASLYMVAQSVNGFVCNTCNLSEDYVGYATKWGDGAGDFSLLMKLTKTEVCEIGKVLGLPDDLVNKAPSDGLCGVTDEARFGFTYEYLDNLIRTNRTQEDEKIMSMYRANLHKDLSAVMPHFEYK